MSRVSELCKILGGVLNDEGMARYIFAKHDCYNLPIEEVERIVQEEVDIELDHDEWLAWAYERQSLARMP